MNKEEKIKNIIQQMIDSPDKYCDKDVLVYLINDLKNKGLLDSIRLNYYYDTPVQFNLMGYLQYKNNKSTYDLESFYNNDGLKQYSYDYAKNEIKKQKEQFKFWNDILTELNVNQEPKAFKTNKNEENYLPYILSVSNFELWLINKVKNNIQISDEVEKYIVYSLLDNQDKGNYYLSNLHNSHYKKECEDYLKNLWNKYSDECLLEVKQKRKEFNLVDQSNKNDVLKKMIELNQFKIDDNEFIELIKKSSNEDNYKSNPDMCINIMKQYTPEIVCQKLIKNNQFPLFMLWENKVKLVTGRSIRQTVQKKHQSYYGSRHKEAFIKEVEFLGKEISKLNINEMSLKKVWNAIMFHNDVDMIKSFAIHMRQPDYPIEKCKNDKDREEWLIIDDQYQQYLKDEIEVELNLDIENKKVKLTVEDFIIFAKKESLNIKLQDSLVQNNKTSKPGKI